MINPPAAQRPYLRVGFATPSLGMGGAERWILSLAKNMRSFRTSCIGHFGSVQHYAIAEEAARIAPVYSATYAPGATAMTGGPGEVASVLINNCDAIITWGIGNTIELFHQCGKPVIDVSHNEARYAENLTLVAQSWKGATHLVGVSQAAARCYPAKCHKEVNVIYNGIEVDRVAPRRDRATFRKRHEIPEDAKVLLFLGRLCPFKHPELLIRALEKLDDSWMVAYVGQGEELLNLEKAAGYIGNRRVRFFPLSMHVGDYYNMADIFVLPSEYEGFPLSMIEAWMAGTPVICTPFECTKELREMHGEVFKLIPDRARPEDLADMAMTVMAEGGRKSEMVAKARGVAWTNYTAAAMAYRWESYLSWVIRTWQESMLETVSQTREKVQYQGDFL
jgi:glycosyltransferase involved in cell wall biosynthesis